MKNNIRLAVLAIGILIVPSKEADAQQRPVVVYAVDMEGGDGVLDTVSVDWRMCEYAINHNLHYKIVFSPVTNWLIKKYSFEDRKKIYKLLLEGQAVKLE